MIAAWLVYGLVMGMLVAVTAFALELVLRLMALPARWLWGGAMLFTLLLMAVAPFRAGVSEAAPSAAAPRFEAVTLDPLPAAPGSTGMISHAHEAFGTALHGALTAAAALVPAGFDRAILVAWLLLSALLAALVAGTYLRVRRRLSGFPIHEVGGTCVRLTPEAGPALVGLLRPEIVVPRWFLDLKEDEQRLVLAHEEAHLRGGDAWLLLLGVCVVVLLPWHPAAYWMLARTRLATEVDCDARILRRDVSPRAYGSLLIDLAARGSGFRLGAPALAIGASHLKRRLLAMNRPVPRFVAARGFAFGALACLGLLAACEAEVPTAAQIEEMDVATAEAQAQRILRLSSVEANAIYTIDGVQVEAAEAHALAPERIAQIEVVKSIGDEAALARVRISTLGAVAAAGSEAAEGAPPPMTPLRLGGPHAADPDAQPVVLLDGEQVDAGTLREFPPDRIESIEVIKGPAAARYSEMPGAENGVIVITTKGAQTPGV